MNLSKRKEWALFTVAFVLVLLGIGLGGNALLTKLHEQQEAQLEFEETNENSVYVGHFTDGAELRRVDDLDRGISCYQATYDKGISCVHTGNFTQE